MENISDIDLSIENLQGVDEFSYQEKSILSLIRILREMSQTNSRIRSICILDLKCSSNEWSKKNIGDHFDRQEATYYAGLEALKNQAIAQGISPERFDEMVAFVIQKVI